MKPPIAAIPARFHRSGALEGVGGTARTAARCHSTVSGDFHLMPLLRDPASLPASGSLESARD